jgi:hypothetical protein
MAMQVIATGSSTDKEVLSQAEASIKDGQNVELRLFVSTAPSEETLHTLELNLINQGVVLWDKVSYDSGVMVIRYVKSSQASAAGLGFAIPLIAWAVIAGVASLGVGIFGWQMAGQTGSLLTNPYLIGAAVLAFGLYLLMRNPHTEEEPR